jgi:hypothetical protein
MMHEIVKVWTIVGCDGRVAAVVSSKELAEAAAPDWHQGDGPGLAQVEPRDAIIIDGYRVRLLGEEMVLNGAHAVQEAQQRMQLPK